MLPCVIRDDDESQCTSTDYNEIIRQGNFKRLRQMLCCKSYQPDILNYQLHLAVSYGHVEIARHLIDNYKCNCSVEYRNSKGQTALHIAFSKGHSNVIRMLMSKLVNLHCLDPYLVDSDGKTVLHYAAQNGMEGIVISLINEHGCDVECTDNSKQTPLHLACGSGGSRVVRMLVAEYKADLKALDEDNNTPLQTAALCGQTDVVFCILQEFGINPDIKRIDAKSLLHLAICQGHTELAKALLTQYKLDLMSHDNDGNTPLHDAAQHGREEIVEIFITEFFCPVDCKNYSLQTPLHLACSQGNRNVVRMLVSEYKADIYAHDKEYNTPLHAAAWYGHTDVINLFIYFVADINVNVKGHHSKSALHLACSRGHTKVVEALFTGSKLNLMPLDDVGNTPLHDAAQHGCEEVVRLLVTKYECPVDCTNNSQQTPLHLACSQGYLGFIGILVTDHKADLNARDENDDTPLHIAALYGQAGVVYCLIEELHCDPYVVGFNGRNILHHACFNDHVMLVRLLIDTFQLSLISGDADGNTPLHLAAMLGQNKCVQMLVDNDHAPVFLRNISGKTALEVSTNSKTRTIINDHLKKEDVRSKIQHDYKQLQVLSTKKYSGAQRLTRIFVMGNIESGKSTLVESMKREGIISSFYQVSEATVPPHTSGIIPSVYNSKMLGRVLFYDFAGDPEYYSSHSAILSNVMQSQGGTNVCLILVNFQKEKKHILDEIGYWLSFISYHSTSLKDKVKVLVLGSHADLLSDTEANRKLEFVSKLTKDYLSHTRKAKLKILNKCLTLNCRYPRSSKRVHGVLLQTIERAKKCRLSTEAAVLLGLLEKDFKNVVTCSFQTLLDHIAGTGICLPTVAKSLNPIVKELHTVGLLMAIGGKSGEPDNSLLILNVTKLTNEIHKLLFSKTSSEQFVLSTDTQSASMGILPQNFLIDFLPKYISTECLVQLQYCQELSHAEVKFNSVIPTNDSGAPTLLYFPALCTKKRKENIETPDCFNYSLSWYVKCNGKFDYLPPRCLHVLFLRLAYSFALPAIVHSPSSETPGDHSASAIQLYNHRCTMWKNGIHWLMEEGVECFVENVNNSKGIVIITKSEETEKSICTEMLFKIVREIQEAKYEFCGTVTLQQYLMNSINPTSFANKDKLFAMKDIHHVLTERKKFIISTTGRRQLDATEFSGLKSFIQYGKFAESRCNFVLLFVIIRYFECFLLDVSPASFIAI